MAPVTPLTAGKIYLLNYFEADPEDYDLDGLTENTDYIEIDIPKRVSDDPDAVGVITPYIGGKGHVFKEDTITEGVIIEGIINDLTTLKNFKLYHAKGKGSTRAISYLVIKYGTNSYYPFVDEDEAAQEQARGWFKSPRILWEDSQNNLYKVRIQFFVVWS